jgi:hypothetical protein
MEPELSQFFTTMRCDPEPMEVYVSTLVPPVEYFEVPST